MKAMILAAGLGTRLRPLTDDRPKALVEIAGRTLLDICLSRLRSLGIREVMVNAHHFADRLVDFLQANENFGMHIEVSWEETLLDTGGGLKKAAHFFLDNRSSDEPFLLHNVDVISNIDIRRMIEFHAAKGALATLAVQARETSRYLLFDERLQLCGRRHAGNGETEWALPCVEPRALAFSGIHVISPRLLTMMTEEGAFSIISCYLRLATQGETLLGFRADGSYWRDLGRPESVQDLERDLREGHISLA